MTIHTQGHRTAEFLLSEGNGQRSREAATLAATATALPAGQLLATVGGKHVAYNPEGVDGSETVTAILYAAASASDADQAVTTIVREAEVSAERLTGLDAAATADLDALGVIVR